MVSKWFFLVAAYFMIINGHIIEENTDPELFQGDMKLNPLQRILAATGGDISLGTMKAGRGTLVPWGPLWLPGRVVPYDIHPDLEQIPDATFAIMKALREWESYTCLTFVKRINETAYIQFITNCSGCWSNVGRQGVKQSICLDKECFQPGTVIHEIAHAMGVCHEQSRPDRDDFVEILWDNLKDNTSDQFTKYGNGVIDSMGFKYDYLSIMHYSTTAFSKNGNFTMIPTKPGVLQLGQRLGFSDVDAKQFSKLYKCKGKTSRPLVKRKHFTLNGKYDCSFEKNECHFTQDVKDDFDWVGRIGPLISSYGGPKHDHTTKRLGRYMSVDSIPPSKEGDVAKLISGLLPPTNATCLSFYYHMFTPNITDMGTLNVYLALDGKMNRLFTRTGSQENDWIQGSALISSQHPYRIIFEGIRGKDKQGDIAIDDVSFIKGRCSSSSANCDIKPKKEKCQDIVDREAKYCHQWEQGGLCDLQREDMMTLCPKTCMFCT